MNLEKTRVGQRVVGNRIDDRRYQVPEGWGGGGEITKVIDPNEEKLTTLLLLQPDKSLNLKPSSCSVHTYIRDFKKAEELVHVLQEKTAEELEDLMDLGKKMAKSHVERFKSFSSMPGKQAVLMFGGDDLDAASFDSKDEKWVETHVRFISGLYGLLRPYDDVKPVRDVPMMAKLKTDRGNTVEAYWSEGITKMLGKDVQEVVKGGSGKVLMVVNMSDDYWKGVLPGGLPKNIRVVQIAFEGANDDNTRKARSMFARHVVRKRIVTVEGLTEFSHDDWVFDKTRSRDARLLYNWDGESSGAAKKKKGEEDKKQKKPVEKGSFAPGYHSDSDASAEGAPKAAAARDPSQASSAAASSDASRKKKASKSKKAAKARSPSADSIDSTLPEKKKSKKKDKGRERSRSRRRRRDDSSGSPPPEKSRRKERRRSRS